MPCDSILGPILSATDIQNLEEESPPNNEILPQTAGTANMQMLNQVDQDEMPCIASYEQ